MLKDSSYVWLSSCCWTRNGLQISEVEREKHLFKCAPTPEELMSAAQMAMKHMDGLEAGMHIYLVTSC